MKKYFHPLLTLLILLIATIGVAFPRTPVSEGEIIKDDKDKPLSEGMKIIQKFQFKPIQVKIPRVGREVERVVLPNGMILYMMEDHSLPQVTIRGLIRTGSVYERKEKHGVAEMMGRVMRTGGTKTRTPQQLNEDLEYIAASVETGIENEYGYISLYSISRQLDKAMEIFADILRNPAFDQKELDLAKSQAKERIRRSNDESDEIGDRYFYKIVFGDHPNGWEPDWNIIKNITREDLIAWYDRFYKPNNMMFAISGDFNKKEMVEKFNKLFGDWQQGDVDFSTLKEVKYEFKPGVHYVVRDVNQSYVRLGCLGVKRTNPDVFKIILMDYILGGGGFNSYMTEKIRSDEGLAYSVYSYYNTNSRDYGTCGAATYTKSKSTIRATELMIQLMKKMQNEKVSEKKLKWAKDSIINGFIFEFAKPSQQVYKLMLLEYEKRPADYYEKYLDNIRKVSADDILQAAKKYLHPDQLTIIIVGKPSDFDKPVSALGKEPQEIKLEEFKE